MYNFKTNPNGYMVTETEHTVTNKYGSIMRVKSVKVHDKLPKEDPEPEMTIVE